MLLKERRVGRLTLRLMAHSSRFPTADRGAVAAWHEVGALFAQVGLPLLALAGLNRVSPSTKPRKQLAQSEE